MVYQSPRYCNKNLQALYKLYDLGAIVLPVDGKRPILKGWNKEPVNRRSIGRFVRDGYRFAIVPASIGLLAIDVDDADQNVLIREIEAGANSFIAVPSRRANRAHIYVRAPEGIEFNWYHARHHTGMCEVRYQNCYLVMYGNAPLHILKFAQKPVPPLNTPIGALCAPVSELKRNQVSIDQSHDKIASAAREGSQQAIHEFGRRVYRYYLMGNDYKGAYTVALKQGVEMCDLNKRATECIEAAEERLAWANRAGGKYPGLTEGQRKTLVACLVWSGEGRRCWASKRSLSAVSGISVRRTYDCIKALSERGILMPTGETMPSKRGSPKVVYEVAEAVAITGIVKNVIQ